MAEQKIIVYDIVSGKAAVATEDGEKLFEKLTSILANNNVAILDFENIDALTSTFLNAAIGQLYNKFDSPFLQTHLKPINMSPEDTELLKRVIDRAKQYFKDKRSIEKPIKDAMDEEQDS
ncbi:MAG: DUF4325 domain-containing protein [Sedimentisphaerales bacterium]